MSRGMRLLYGGPPNPGSWRADEFGKNAKEIQGLNPTDPTDPISPVPLVLPSIVVTPAVDPKATELLQSLQSGLVELRLDRKSKLTEKDRAKLDELVGQVTALKHVLGV